MKELIQKWLDGRRSYTYGVILYKQLGGNEKHKELLDKGRTDYTQKLLMKLLQELIDDVKPEKAAPPVITVYEQMPETDCTVLQALKDEWMPLFTKMNYKRHELDKFLSDEVEEAEVLRGQLAQQILELEKECMAVWAKRDYYEKYKHLPGKDIGVKEPVIDKFAAGKRIQTLGVYLRRYRGQLKKNPKNARAAELLKQYQYELDKLNKIHAG